jgi:hypothetical protein
VLSRWAGLLPLEQAELLPEQGDLQVLGPLGAAARREQLEQEREELRDERPDHLTSASVCYWISIPTASAQGAGREAPSPPGDH